MRERVTRWHDVVSLNISSGISFPCFLFPPQIIRPLLNCMCLPLTRPGRVWLVTSRLGTGKSQTFFLQCTGDTSFLSSAILSMLVKAWIWTVYSICVMHMKFSRPDSHAESPIYLCFCMTSVSHSCHENLPPPHQFKPVCFHCFAPIGCHPWKQCRVRTYFISAVHYLIWIRKIWLIFNFILEIRR